MNRIVQGDNLEVLRGMATGSVALVYIDPPFNTGRRQTRLQMKTVRDPAGDRVGFGGHRYRTELVKPVCEAGSAKRAGYDDRFDDFLGFLRPRLLEAYRVLAPTGSLFFHIDFREVHYCKVMLDEIFGRDCFQNEIVWAYDYGARATKRWPAKHDNILVHARSPALHLQPGRERSHPVHGAGAGGCPQGRARQDAHRRLVAHHRLAHRQGEDRLRHEKPLGILERIVRVHSNPGDLVLDFFAGSGTTGEAAAKNGRAFCMVNSSAEAIAVMEKRLQLKAERI